MIVNSYGVIVDSQGVIADSYGLHKHLGLGLTEDVVARHVVVGDPLLPSERE